MFHVFPQSSDTRTRTHAESYVLPEVFSCDTSNALISALLFTCNTNDEKWFFVERLINANALPLFSFSNISGRSKDCNMNTQGAGFEFAHNQSFDPVEWRCAAKIFTRTRRKMHIKTY